MSWLAAFFLSKVSQFLRLDLVPGAPGELSLRRNQVHRTFSAIFAPELGTDLASFLLCSCLQLLRCSMMNSVQFEFQVSFKDMLTFSAKHFDQASSLSRNIWQKSMSPGRRSKLKMSTRGLVGCFDNQSVVALRRRQSLVAVQPRGRYWLQLP